MIKTILYWFFGLIVFVWSVGMTIAYVYKQPCEFRTFSAKVTDVHADIDAKLFDEVKSLQKIGEISNQEIANKYSQNIVTINNIFTTESYPAYKEVHGAEHYGVAEYTYPAQDKGNPLPFFLAKVFKKGDYISQCQNVYVNSRNRYPESKK